MMAIGAIAGQASKDIGFISGFFAGQSAGDKELRRLRADFAAAKERRNKELGDTLGRVKAINASKAAGAGVELGSFNKSAGAGQAKNIAQRDIEELTRQYVTRRDAIWDAQSSASENFKLTGIITAINFAVGSFVMPPSQTSELLSVSEGLTGVGGTPFTPADGSGPSAGEISSIAGAFGGGQQPVSSAAKPGVPSGSVSSPVTGNTILDDPAGATAPLGTQTSSLLGTRRNYAWYA